MTTKNIANNLLNSVYRISRMVRKSHQPGEKHDEFSVHKWFVLTSVDNDKNTISAIAKEMNVALPTVTVAVERLVQEDLVKRTADTEDRRKHILELTRKGRKQLEKARAEKASKVQSVLELLDPKDAAELARIVEVLAEKMEQQKEGNQ